MMADENTAVDEKSLVESEFEEFENDNTWNLIFQRLRNESTLDNSSVSNKAARLPQNRNKNRYRDILPYDHTRIILQGSDADYINASMLEIAEADRRYILTQGPLSNTLGDFWTMCWQQETRGIVMLSRLFEKDTAKCHPYYPDADEPGDSLNMPDAGLRVSLLKYEDFSYYIVRTLSLQNLTTNEHRDVLHYQYLTWPDFGCPHSPASFLNFLLAVRRAGVLSPDCGPCIVHCSAGVGRSGSFCLVDSALRIIERSRSLSGINLRSMLIIMRRSRVGLIQSSDQLRFTYQAIIEGGHALLNLEPTADPDAALSFETMEADVHVPPSASTSSSEPAEHVSLPSSSAASSAASSTKSLNQEVAGRPEDVPLIHADAHVHASSKRRSEELQDDNIDAKTRQMLREQRRSETQRMLENMKRKQREHELLQGRWGKLLPYRRQITTFGLCVTALVCAVAYGWYLRSGDSADSSTLHVHHPNSPDL